MEESWRSHVSSVQESCVYVLSICLYDPRLHLSV